MLVDSNYVVPLIAFSHVDNVDSEAEFDSYEQQNENDIITGTGHGTGTAMPAMPIVDTR